jgi:4-hydroxybenzoate polyprenyltransferase
MAPWLEILRPGQWYKSLFCLLPLALTPCVSVAACLQLLLAFSLAASAVYVFNDLCDLEVDRQQKDRCFRPLPSGEINTRAAVGLIPLLGVLAVLVWPAELSLRWLCVYWAVNIVYNLVIKRHQGYGLATAIVIESCYLVRMMPLIALDGVVSRQEALLMLSVGLVLWPIIVWKQRSYLLSWMEKSDAYKPMGQIGIGLGAIVVFPVIGYACLPLWLLGLLSFLKILSSRGTREPCQALFRT